MSPDEFYARLEDHAKQTKSKIGSGAENDANERTFEPGQAKIGAGTLPSAKVSTD